MASKIRSYNYVIKEQLMAKLNLLKVLKETILKHSDKISFITPNAVLQKISINKMLICFSHLCNKSEVSNYSQNDINNLQGRNIINILDKTLFA